VPASRSNTCLAEVSPTMRLSFGQHLQRRLVRDRAPEEGGDGFLFHALESGRDPRLAEIFLRDHVGRDLRPVFGHFHCIEPEYDRAVRIPDLAHRGAERNLGVGRLAFFRISALDAHCFVPLNSAGFAPALIGFGPLTWAAHASGTGPVSTSRTANPWKRSRFHAPARSCPAALSNRSLGKVRCDTKQAPNGSRPYDDSRERVKP
jgi:hypothetical protein